MVSSYEEHMLYGVFPALPVQTHMLTRTEGGSIHSRLNGLFFFFFNKASLCLKMGGRKVSQEFSAALTTVRDKELFYSEKQRPREVGSGPD